MIINLNSETDLSGFYVVYNGSVNIENKGIQGLSHLMEHLLCKNLDHLQDEYDIDGIEFNAYTSNNNIVFYIKGLDEKIIERRTEFLELLLDFNVTKEDFENERNIVLEEYYDSFSEPTAWHYLNLERKLYDNYNPIGCGQDLKSLKYIDCIDFFKEQFLKPSKIINVSKSSEFGGDISFLKEPSIRTYDFNPNREFILEGDLSQSNKTSLIFKSPLFTDDFAVSKFINLMLSYGLNSPLYQEIREKRGLVYYVSLSTNRMGNQADIDFSTLTSDENVDKVIEVTKTIFDNYDKFLTKERFDIIKESVKVSVRKNEILRYSSVDKFISPESWSISNILDTVTLDECLSVFNKYYTFDNMYISNSKTEFK